METHKNQKEKFLLFCWNIGNPSAKKAAKQAEWLRKRPEDVFVLTEAKLSEGCLLLERYFQAYGYNVIFQKLDKKEFAVIIISKLQLIPSNFSVYVDYLQTRVASVKLTFSSGEIEVIGVYVPSRDSSSEKTERKKRFLKSLIDALEKAPRSDMRIFCGDFNILEPNHIPHYQFFEEWEYDFYRNLTKYQLKDAFRYLHPFIQEYSWVGHTGDGYRYDHCFVSENLLPSVKSCYYFHETRGEKLKLSDHSALIVELDI
jgi:exodeoxyribonuclease-3